MKPNIHRVKELLTYNHRTGNFHWKQKPYGLRGYDNPTNIAGCIDPITKERMIRIDATPFLAKNLIKFFPIDRSQAIQTILSKKISGISWAKSKRSYRVRIFNEGKTINVGHSRNFEESVFMKLAAEQCSGLKINKKSFSFCKNLVGGIK